MSIDECARKIVSKCKNQCSSEYEIALWLHDWLTSNANYDYTYTHYGMDGVLLFGTGVCDSYSKAYYKLLTMAGVSCRYINGDTTAGFHAWNAVSMDGQWYWVDVTWDDPGRGGYERHLYFGLPDEILSVDHDVSGSGLACTSYADNYFIRSGQVELWTPYFVQKTNSFLNEGWFKNSVPLPDYYETEHGTYTYGNEHIVYNITAYALKQIIWSIEDQSVYLDFQFDASNAIMNAAMRFDGVEYILPSHLSVIEEESFRGNGSVLSITIPESVKTISASAFSQCSGLWRVLFPETFISIDPTAFSGCPHVTLVGVAGSWAEEYSRNNSLHFIPAQ